MCYNPAPERLLMKEFGDGRDRDLERRHRKRRGDREKRVFRPLKRVTLV